MLWVILSIITGFALLTALKPALRAMHMTYTIGRPSLWQVLRHDGSKVTVSYYKPMEKTLVKSAMADGGKQELDRLIRNTLNLKENQQWSVDYILPNLKTDGTIEPGGSYPEYTDNFVSIYVYDVIAPPPPLPPPPPPPTMSELEEKLLDELYAANPTAFWLKPDWERAEREKVPFWVLDCYPVGSQVDEVEDCAMLWRIAQEMDYGKLIELHTYGVSQRFGVYCDPSGETIHLSASQIATIREIRNAIDRGDVIITRPEPYGFIRGRGQEITKKKKYSSYC